MKLIFVTDARFIKDNDGNIYSESSFGYELWKRYLSEFSEVVVMARVKFEPNPNYSVLHLSSGDKVQFIELPYFLGIYQLVLKSISVFKAINKAINSNIDNRDVVFLCRVPSVIGTIVAKKLIRKKRNYGVEVVGDPWEVFGENGIQHPLRKLFRLKSYRDLIEIVKNAYGVLYVTKKALQDRYPANKTAFQIDVSDVIIADEGFPESFKKFNLKEEYTLISVGSLAQMYKAPDIVLKAVKKVRDNGINCRLIWLGDGIYKASMVELANQLRINDCVDFRGNVNGLQVKEALLSSDVFVLASRTEGLPRAIVEAMAEGLPCIASNVGGIPELLPEDVLVPVNNVDALAAMMEKFFNDSDFYDLKANQNLEEAKKYKKSILDAKRLSFFNHLKTFN